MMMKRWAALLLTLAVLCTAAVCQAGGLRLLKKMMPETETLAFTAQIRMGWNLGNTFDASDCYWTNELGYETAWCGAKTTEALLDALKEAGFNAVRIPVSWHNHVSGENHEISEKWLSRVQEVVDWCMQREMFVIVNIHHDNSLDYIYPDEAHLEQSLHYIRCIWQQLAARFADYDEHLILEAMNEPRLVGHANEWYFNPAVPACVEAADCINQLNQAFVDTVRAGGGYNETRYLLCPGYDGAPETAAGKYFELPTDPVETNDRRIMVEAHAYSPYEFALADQGKDTWSRSSSSDLSGMTGGMQQLYNRFIIHGIGVVMDEFGARNRKGNTEARCEFAQSYVAEVRSRGIPCFWWDNNAYNGGEEFGLIDRRTCTWVYPEIVESMMSAIWP